MRKIHSSTFQEKFKNTLRQWATDPENSHFEPENPDSMDPATREIVEFVNDVHQRGSAERPDHDEFHVENVMVQVEMSYATLVELTTYLHEAHESFAQDAQKAMILGMLSGGLTEAHRESMAKSTVLSVSAMEMTAQLNDIRRDIKSTISIPQAHTPHPEDDLMVEGAIISLAGDGKVPEEAPEAESIRPVQNQPDFGGLWFQDNEGEE